MASRKRRLDKTIATLRHRYGEDVLQPADRLVRAALPPHVATGFADLDALTGCGGLPRGALTILRGRTTSGKLTLAYQILRRVQDSGQRSSVALLDLSASADPDYLTRCGVDLDRLVLVRPPDSSQVVDVLRDLLAQRQIGAVLVDNLPHLFSNREQTKRINDQLAGLHRQLRQGRCVLLCLDEPQPFWMRWLGWHASHQLEQWTALHLELQREEWLYSAKQLSGYRARALLRKSRWSQGGGSAPVAFQFNDTGAGGAVTAARTW